MAKADETDGWDAKVNQLHSEPPAVGTRFIANNLTESTCAGVIAALSEGNVELLTDGAKDALSISWADLICQAPTRTSAEVGTFVRALFPTEIDSEKVRAWHYGWAQRMLAGGEVAVVKCECDHASTPMCVFDVQYAGTQ
jgi:hypothetical protein